MIAFLTFIFFERDVFDVELQNKCQKRNCPRVFYSEKVNSFSEAQSLRLA